MQKGVALGQILSFDPATDTFSMYFQGQDAALVAQSGAAWVRMNLRVDHYPRWDGELLTRYISTIELLRAVNPAIQVIGLLSHELVPGASQERWNRNSTEHDTSADPINFFIEEYVANIEALLGLRDTAGRTITDYVSHWEVWNEPNAWTEHDPSTVQADSGGIVPLPGGTFIFPSLLASILRRAAARIHAVQPDGTLIVGGLFCHDSDDGIAYLTSVFDELSGEPLPFDGIAMHYYLNPGAALDTGKLTTYLTALQNFLVVREGAADRHPIFITEVGWSAPPLGMQLQATNLTSFFHTCATALPDAQDMRIEAACWYTLYDTPAAKGDHGFGLYVQRLQPKPAFAAFQAVS